MNRSIPAVAHSGTRGRAELPPARPAARGFTLIELMVVVVVIGLLAALAVPSMRIGTYDRHAYQDAGAIMHLFREARLRAVARGGATLVQMSANGTSDRGTFSLYEADAQNAGVASATYQTPVPSCKSPTIWNTNAAATPIGGALNATLPVDKLDLNGNPEVEADIETTLTVFGPALTNGVALATGTHFQALSLCFTPLGRSYMLVYGQAAYSAQTPDFDGLQPNTSLVQAQVTRGTSSGVPGATVRNVLIVPNGMPRLLSQGQ